MTRRIRSLTKSFIQDPDSEGIATTLTRTSSNRCEHGENPCFLRCGVRRAKVNRYYQWVAIPLDERRKWLEGQT